MYIFSARALASCHRRPLSSNVRRQSPYRLPLSGVPSHTMQVVTGTVVDGRVVVQGAALPEGALVTVLTLGANESFTLSAEDEAELLEALAEIDRGEHLSLEQLLETLPRRS